MKHLKTITAFAVTVFSLAACQKQTQLLPAVEKANPAALQEVKQGDEGVDFRQSNNHVYTLSNQVSGNKVMDYKRANNGTLTFSDAYATGGTGTGGGLGNQGAVILAEDDELLLAVNSGSNSISSFNVSGSGLYLK